MLFPKPLTAMEGGLGVGKICSESSSSLSHLTHLVDAGSVWLDSLGNRFRRVTRRPLLVLHNLEVHSISTEGDNIWKRDRV